VTRVRVVGSSDVERAGLETLLGGRGHVVVRRGAADAGPDPLDAASDVLLVLVEEGGDPPRMALAPDAAARAPAIVALTDAPSRAWALRAVRGGVHAVLPRTATIDAITAAIDAAAAGLIVLPADIVGGVPAAQAAGTAAPPEALTPREAQILALLAEGLVNKQIAARLGISRHTVKTHLGALFHKLGATTRTEAVAAGARAGILLL
jgi:NarL family two-component system response regulator YdfI